MDPENQKQDANQEFAPYPSLRTIWSTRQGAFLSTTL